MKLPIIAEGRHVIVEELRIGGVLVRKDVRALRGSNFKVALFGIVAFTDLGHESFGSVGEDNARDAPVQQEFVFSARVRARGRDRTTYSRCMQG